MNTSLNKTIWLSRNYLLFVLCIVLSGCNNATIIKPTRKNIYEAVYASGRIIAANEHNIFAVGNGTVIKKLVNDGDTVKEHQALFEIQNIAVTSALKVSSDKVNLLQQFSSTDKMQENVFIYSDCKGIVFQTKIEQGEVVHANQPLALVGNIEKRVLELTVDQQDITKIKAGQQVLLKTDITSDSTYKALVTKIYSLMNETGQSFRVDAAFNEKFPYPFIHTAVEANIIINEKKEALVIPRDAIRGKDSLLIKSNGNPQMIKVKTGITSTDYIEIIKGVDENTLIIIPQNK
jgi:multidrug efflux pump subunit AcrA (membrane-fusion protein)